MNTDWLNADPLADGVQDYELVPNNEQVPVEIVKTELPSEEKLAEGKFWVHLHLKVDKGDDKFYSKIHHYLNFPKPEDDAEVANRKKLAFRDFCEAFGINGADRFPAQHELWVGRCATALVSQTSDPQYGQRNEIKRFLK